MSKFKDEVYAVIAAIERSCADTRGWIFANEQTISGLEHKLQETKGFIDQWRIYRNTIEADIITKDQDKSGLAVEIQKSDDAIRELGKNQAGFLSQISVYEQKRSQLQSKQQEFSQEKIQLETQRLKIEAQISENDKATRDLEFSQKNIAPDIEQKRTILTDLQGRLSEMGRARLSLLDQADKLQSGTTQYFSVHLRAAQLNEEMAQSVTIPQEIAVLQGKVASIAAQIDASNQRKQKLIEEWGQNRDATQRCFSSEVDIGGEMAANDQEISQLQYSLQQAGATRQSWRDYRANIKMHIDAKERDIQALKESLVKADNGIAFNEGYIADMRNQIAQEESKVAVLFLQLQEECTRMSGIVANAEAQSQGMLLQQVSDLTIRDSAVERESKVDANLKSSVNVPQADNNSQKGNRPEAKLEEPQADGNHGTGASLEGGHDAVEKSQSDNNSAEHGEFKSQEAHSIDLTLPKIYPDIEELILKYNKDYREGKEAQDELNDSEGYNSVEFESSTGVQNITDHEILETTPGLGIYIPPEGSVSLLGLMFNSVSGDLQGADGFQPGIVAI